jgi:hypothetical protein
LTGNVSSTATGSVTPSITIFVPIAGNSVTATRGLIAPILSIGLTGNTATATVGSVGVQLDALVIVTGVFGTGEIGTASVYAPTWVLVPNNQTPAWGVIDDSQSPVWSGIITEQTPGWSFIPNEQTSGWTDVPTVQSPAWDLIDT